MGTTKADALNILKGIVATHDKFRKFAADIKSDDVPLVEKSLGLIICESIQLGNLDILTLAFRVWGNLDARKITKEPGMSSWRHHVANHIVNVDICFGELECLTFLVEEGANLRTLDTVNHTHAIVAARYGKLECLFYLKDKGASLESLNIWGMAPQHFVAENCDLACLKFLFNVDVKGRYGIHPAHFASVATTSACLRFLAEREKVLEAEREKFLESSIPSWWTPAYYADAKDSLATMKFLVELGVDISVKD